MSKQVTIQYFGMEGTGRTLTEAKQDAGRRIEKAVTGSYLPFVQSYRGQSVLVWRELERWQFRLLTDYETGAVRDGFVYGCGAGQDTFDDVVKAAKYALAQTTWQPEDGDFPPDFLKSEDIRREFKSWAAWQLRYRAHRANGMSDVDAHRAAFSY